MNFKLGSQLQHALSTSMACEVGLLHAGGAYHVSRMQWPHNLLTTVIAHCFLLHNTLHASAVYTQQFSLVTLMCCAKVIVIIFSVDSTLIILVYACQK